jgi:hypothetical protein
MILPPPHLDRLGFMLLSTFIGLSMIFDWSKSLRLGKASVSWPRAQGRLLQAGDELLPGTNVRFGGNMHVEIGTVEYEFSVNGKSYRGSMINVAGSATYGRGHTLEKYRPGSAVEVSYDPKDPRRSMLEPGVYHDAYSWICIGSGILLLGVAMVLF